MDATRPNTDVPACPGCAQRDLRIAPLEAKLQELSRAGKRQAAPFSKGPPNRTEDGGAAQGILASVLKTSGSLRQAGRRLDQRLAPRSRRHSAVGPASGRMSQTPLSTSDRDSAPFHRSGSTLTKDVYF